MDAAASPAWTTPDTHGNSVPSGSQHEDYGSTSGTYDSLRRAIGIQAYHEALTRVAGRRGCSVSDLTLLEGGCGTANYLATLQPYVQHAIGVEYNEGMLSKATEKLAGLENVRLMQGNVCSMHQIEDESVDAVMVNQVIHHLFDGSDGTDPFHAVRAAFQDIHRVLRPGGCFILQTQTPIQHNCGFWWADLIPTAADKLACRFPTKQWLQNVLCAELDMCNFRTHVPDDPLVALEAYHNIEAPFNKLFRDADSTWALVADEELEVGLKKLRNIIDSGRSTVYMKLRETQRAAVGQTTTVIVEKREA